MEIQTKYAERWDKSSEFFYSKGYYQWMGKALAEYKTILEIGCGCGYSTLSLVKTGHRVLAIDKNPVCIDMAYNLLKKSGYQDAAAFLEIDISQPGAVEELATQFQYDAVICWNIGSYYEINELRDVYVPRMIEYGLTPEQINSNIASSYCEYITWNACKVAALKEVPLQIVDRNEKAIILENDEYYTLLGREFGYGRIEYNSKAGESISGEGVKLLKKGKIQDEAIVPIVFNMIMFS